MPDHHEISSFIWQIADLLRGPYRPPQYERVMLPLTVLRRFDCVLAPTKDKVLKEYEKRKGGKLNDEAIEKYLNKIACQRFHNHSPLTFEKLKGDPDHIEKHLVSYIKGFSKDVRTIFDYFEFESEIEKMREANILYLVVRKFCDIDLHPDKVDNIQMGLAFEDLIRRFNEAANETAGDHFTPREVIKLMVSLLFRYDDALLSVPGTVRKMLDPACGTSGMLSEAQNYMREHHKDAKLYTYGQDYNKRAFATAASDMLIKQVDHNGTDGNIRFGDTFTDDQFEDESFDYFLTNPPFGVDWKKQQKELVRQQEKLGEKGRFAAGFPRINDGALLFLQHMISKFEDVQIEKQKYGSRLAIVFNGSPLFTGGAGSGESDIRKWIIEKDWLEAIIALPEQMFYNTGIGTYIWLVTNRKEDRRKGKIQFVDARETYISMRRSMGNKRRKIGEGKDGEPNQIAEIVKLYDDFSNTDLAKTFDNAEFGYTRVTVERPLRLRYELTVDRKSRFLDALPSLLDDVQEIDKELGREPNLDWNKVWENISKVLEQRGSKWRENTKKLFRDVFTEKDATATPVKNDNGGFEPDADLRDFENIPLKENIDQHFKREVLPHVSDAWMDRTKDKVGYEINFNRYFYKYIPPRPLEEIDADLKKAEDEIMRLLSEVAK
jgi:type I restriction enzyme M protein